MAWTEEEDEVVTEVDRPPDVRDATVVVAVEIEAVISGIIIGAGAKVPGTSRARADSRKLSSSKASSLRRRGGAREWLSEKDKLLSRASCFEPCSGDRDDMWEEEEEARAATLESGWLW